MPAVDLFISMVLLSSTYVSFYLLVLLNQPKLFIYTPLFENMRPSLPSLTALALSFAGSALADFQGKLNQANPGCNIKGVQSVQGYSANFYDYPYGNSIFTDSNFYQGQYMGNADPIATVAVVPNPDFASNADFHTTAFAELYGVPNIPITNFALDLNGHFYGTYSFPNSRLSSISTMSSY